MLKLGKKQEIQPSSGSTEKFQKARWNQDYKRNLVGVDDMTLLSTLSNEAINSNLSMRLNQNEIYTYIGNVLISVNPFKELPIYTESMIENYVGRTRLECSPHIYAIAESALSRMKAYQESQCVIISGESGAGKTEAAKKIMQYISSTVPCTESNLQHIKEMVMATNPLLESFGNAKTLRNHNSSRFGKYLEIFFNPQHEPIGANIRHYLLEKSRVVHQIPLERNFHIFYQVCKEAHKKYPDLGLSSPEHFKYTSQSQCYDVDGIDDQKEYKEVIEAMNVIGLSTEEQTSIHHVLAGILWLGNLTFQENPKESGIEIMNMDALKWTAHVLCISEAKLQQALTQKSIVTPKGAQMERIFSPLNVVQANIVRDAMAKALYIRLFDWIVSRVNKAMKSSSTVSATSIGILDIYGFEVFDENNFEQLCINFVNEKLQQIFIELTLKAEQEDYIAEGIEWTPIAFFDNKIVCELIEEKKPPGVFAILCDVCARIHGDTEKSDSFFSTQLGTLSHPRLTTKGAKFMIKHYAGDVTYEMTGMCEKNRDQLNKDVLEAIKESTLPFLHSLFPEPVDWDQRQRPSMVSEKMRQSAMDLSKTLMSCHPNYVRCIKPNQSKKPLLYTKDLALHQVQYLGLLQNVKVRRAGFAAREPFQLFLQRFYMLSLITCYAGSCSWTGDLKRGCELILKHSGISQQQWQLGKSKVFIKTPETMFKLEALRDKYWHSMARRIQKAWHKYQKKRIESAEKIQAFWKNSSGKNVYVQLRDLGHTVLNQQKERRRFSLLSMRRYMGDYLDVSGSGGMYLRTAAELSQEELILFSLRVEVPVYRLLRGAKLSPRMLVLTDRFLCLVATVKEDQKMVQKLVTKVPITDIQKLEVSPFQDDFVMFHLKDKEDCLIVCPFKNELLTYFVYQWKTPVVFSTEIITTDKANHKKRTTKFIKEDTLQACVFKFKGDKVLVTSGAPPTSVSQPPIRRSKVSQKVKEVSNPAVPKPPSNSVFKKNQPASHAIPVQSKPTPPIPVASTSFTSRKGSMYVVLFTFEAHQTTELGIVEGEEVEELQAEASGWSLVKNKHGKEGWVPSSYLKR